MNNSAFNKKIKQLYNSTSSDTKLIELIGKFEISNNLTQLQHEICTDIKLEADRYGVVSSINKYLLDE
jgi:hypothetical protein